MIRSPLQRLFQSPQITISAEKLCRKSLLRLLQIRWHMRLLILGFALSVAAFSIAVPWLQRTLMNELAQGNTASAIRLMFAAFAATAFSQILSLCQRFTASREGAILSRGISSAYYLQTLRLSAQARMQRTVGELTTYYSQDISAVVGFIEEIFPNGCTVLISFIVAPIVLQQILSIPLSAILLIMVFAVGLNTILAYRQAHFFWNNKRFAQRRLSIVNEWLQNMRAVRILNWRSHFEKEIFDARNVETKNRLSMVVNGSSMNAIAQTVPLIINISGVLTLAHVRGQALQPGDIFAVLWIFGVFLARPMRMFAFVISNFIDTSTSAKRLEGFFALPTESTDDGLFRSATSQKTAAALAINIKNLNLEIDGHKILSNLSLEIPAGQFVAIIGEVGSGKTTLLHSLLRALPAHWERYEVGTEKVETLPLIDLRQFFGYVPQDGFVMSAALRDNVAFAYETESQLDSMISECLALASFDTETENLPAGLMTEIGERGVNLSGGQKQRVSLARCTFFSRPILLLDDCLSAVDAETEQRLVRNLFCGRWRKHTRILVTHRLSILEHVDWIYFMEGGRIVEEGTYRNLLASSARLQTFQRRKEQEQKST